MTLSHFYTHGFHLQHSQLVISHEIASSSIPAGDYGKCMTTFRLVSDKSSVFTATVLAYRILWFFFFCKHTQFAKSCMQPQTQQAVRIPHFLGMHSVIQITKPGKISSKIFVGNIDTKIFLHKKLKQLLRKNLQIYGT